MGASYIGTEHLLLALAREGEGVGGRLMAAAGLDYAAADRLVSQIYGKREDGPDALRALLREAMDLIGKRAGAPLDFLQRASRAVGESAEGGAADA